MKRLHVHVSVGDLSQSVRFYSALFATAPTVVKADYAKWMLDDPRVNFAISSRGGESGLDHFGIQVESPDELREVYTRLQQADRPVLEEGATTCCYAKSEKAWIADPQGIAWETFLTTGESTVYGDSADLGSVRTVRGIESPSHAAQDSCCAPPSVTPAKTTCCGAAA